MDSITLNAYAKINLFLEVCEKRPDNYHNIDSIMQTVSLCDVVTVSKDDTIIVTNTAGLPNDKSNLAYKAANLFFEHFGIKNGCKIHIQKNIPISAGLAGGSTDAAAVLKGLNTIYNINASVDTLCALGAKLGADVPFCIKGGTFITKGIGDVMTPCKTLPDCYIVVSKTGEGVSTPYAYGEIDKYREQNKHTIKTSDKIISSLDEGKLEKICSETFNIFESVVCPIRPMVNEQKSIMNSNNALVSMMSGSGPSVFGVFVCEQDAVNAVQQLDKFGAQAFVCRPII